MPGWTASRSCLQGYAPIARSSGISAFAVATLERPHRARFFVAHPEIHYELDHLIDAIYGGGCRMTLVFRSRPHTQVGRALHPFLTPTIQILVRDELERDLAELAIDVAASDNELGENEARSRAHR